MDNNTNTTPELKNIYDNLMDTAQKDAGTPVNEKQPEAATTAPQATMPPTPTNNEPASPQPTTSVTQSSMASMAGTVTGSRPKSSHKAIYFLVSFIFVIAWGAFWAVFFGFITI